MARTISPDNIFDKLFSLEDKTFLISLNLFKRCYLSSFVSAK